MPASASAVSRMRAPNARRCRRRPGGRPGTRAGTTASVAPRSRASTIRDSRVPLTRARSGHHRRRRQRLPALPRHPQHPTCPAARRGVTPDTGITIGLQLEPHGELIGRSGILLLRLLHLTADTQHVLHVMTDLVRRGGGPARNRRAHQSVTSAPRKTKDRDRPSRRRDSKTSGGGLAVAARGLRLRRERARAARADTACRAAAGALPERLIAVEHARHEEDRSALHLRPEREPPRLLERRRHQRRGRGPA